MRRFILSALVLFVAVWAGCSSKDEGNPLAPSPPAPPRVVANDSIASPAMLAADEPVWNFVTKYAVDISTLVSPKLPAPSSLTAPDSVYVQAIVNTFFIYLRVEFADDSLNLLRDYMETRDIAGNFNIMRFSQEDQVYVMFSGMANDSWDVWNWRSLTTGSAGLAEGFVFDGNSLIVDAGSEVVADSNFSLPDTLHPIYVDSAGKTFTGQILYKWRLDSFLNHAAEYLQSGLVVPGWWVDDSVGYRVSQPGNEQSRWNVFTVHTHNSSTNKTSVVFRRRLYSPYPDDLDLVDSVKIKIGIYNNQSDFGLAGSRRGFTDEFWLIL